MRLFAVWIQLDYTVVLRVVTAMGENGLYDPLTPRVVIFGLDCPDFHLVYVL